MPFSRRKQNIAARMERTDRVHGHRRSSGITTVLSVVVILSLVVLAIVYRDRITVENIVNFTPSNLWLAALVFMALYAVKG